MRVTDNTGGLWGMRLFMWSYLAKGILVLLSGLVSMILSEVSLAYQDWIQVVHAVRTGGTLVALAICLIGLWLFLAFASRIHVKGLVKGAIAALAVALVQRSLILGTYLFLDLDTVASLSFLHALKRWTWLVGLAGETGCLVLVTLVVVQVIRVQDGSGSTGLTTTMFALLGTDLVLAGLASLGLLNEAVLRAPWLVMGLDMGIDIAILVVLFLMVLAHLGPPATGPTSSAAPEQGGEVDRFLDPPWPAVHSGLRVYRAGLIAKLSVILGGFALMALSAISRDQDFVRIVLVLMSFLGMGATVWMMAGMGGFTRVPHETGGRPGAVVAIIVMGIGLVLDGYALQLVFRMFSGRASAAFDAMDQMPYVEGIAQVLGLLGMLAILSSFGRLGRFADSEPVTSRIGLLIGLLIGVALSAFLLRLLTAERVIRGLAALPLAIIVLGMAVLAVLLYLRLLKDLQRAIGGV